MQNVFLLIEEDADSAFNLLQSWKNRIKPKDKNYPVYIGALSHASFKGNYFPETIAYGKELAALFPDIPEDEFNYGRLYMFVGDFEESIKIYLRCLEKEPEIANKIFNNLGNTYYYAKRYRECINTLYRIPVNARRNSTHVTLAESYYHLNNIDSARICIDTYLAANGDTIDVQGYTAAAKIYYALGDQVKACKYIQDANKMLTFEGIDQEIAKLPERKRKVFIWQEWIKETEETKNLLKTYCE